MDDENRQTHNLLSDTDITLCLDLYPPTIPWTTNVFGNGVLPQQADYGSSSVLSRIVTTHGTPILEPKE